MENIDLTFQIYYRPLCLYATHYLHDVDGAEDVVQDCFVRLLEKSHQSPMMDDHATSSFLFPQNLKSFLYTSVRNACIDRLRRKNPIDKDVSPSDLLGVISDEQARRHDLSGDSRGIEFVGKNGGTPDFQGLEDLARQER